MFVAWLGRIRTSQQHTAAGLRARSCVVRPNIYAALSAMTVTDRLGMLFCPLLPIINTLKLITIFYFRAFAVYFFNKPPNTLFPVASTKNFYMGLLTLTLFLCTLPITYTLASLNPSTGCGPFRYVTMAALKPCSLSSLQRSAQHASSGG